MTNLSAGGAEREAREIHEAVERGYERWNKESQCGEPSCGCVTAYIELELEAIWDAALEKCANEARLEALEQAAQMAQSRSKYWRPESSAYTELQDMACAIRALKAAPAVAMTESTPQQLRDAEPEPNALPPQCGSSDLAAPAHRGVGLTGTQVHAAVNECVGLHGIGPDFPSTWVDSDINFNELAIEINKRLAEPKG